MSMIISDCRSETYHTGGLRFAVTVFAAAALTMIAVPAAALALSYFAGGLATSTILFVYLLAFMTNGPFLLAVLMMTAGLLAMPRLIATLAQAHA